jgi:hypothetical protein
MVHPYMFAVHDGSAGFDSLGGIRLANDREAFAFGKQIIRDLTYAGAEQQYVGWAMDITRGKRAVGSIAFDLRANLRKNPRLSTARVPGRAKQKLAGR